jgi:LPXTG-motif cell wall-anchored protein
MRTSKRIRPAWIAPACVLALLALTIGSAQAAVPSTTAYHFSSHPMISGTVVTVNDHQMVVNTDQGEQVTLEVDSRTMAPRDFAPGMVMRAEFLALEDCRLYAQRIIPIRDGMSLNRLQAYANTNESHDAMARHTPGFSGERWGESATSAESRHHMPQMMEHHSSGMTMEHHSSGTTLTATPTTADYRFSTRPMVSGSVISVNDHQMILESDQGQRVGLVMDSRTMVPSQVAPGSVVRTEFTPMKDGRYLAKRISWIGNDVASREQAYAHTRDSDIAIARNIPDCGYVSATSGDAVTSTLERRNAVDMPDAVIAQNEPAPVAERLDVLPQTASNQPLLLLLGLLSVGSAGLVSVVRGLRKI